MFGERFHLNEQTIWVVKQIGEHIPGDVNGDGKVNTADLIRLLKYLNGQDVKIY